MRIRQFQLIRYGKFTDHVLELPPAERDIHLIVGPNEAGKSTTRAALGDWLFGIKPHTTMAFLHSMPDLRLGGVLEADGQRLDFHRTKGNKNTLRTPDDIPLPDTALQPWLGDTQRPLFEQMFSLNHSALLAGGEGILSAKDDVGRMLFQSASGLEQLGRVLKGLEAEADSLWGPRKSEKRLYSQAMTDFDAANTALKEATARAKGWKAQQDVLADVEQQLVALRAEREQARRQREQLERVRRVAPWLQRHDAAMQARQALGEVPVFPEQAAEWLTSTDRELALADAQAQRCQATVQEANKALENLPPDAPCLALASEITELDARRIQYRAHRPDIEKRAAEIEVHWLGVQAKAHGLGWEASAPQTVRQRLPATGVRTALAALLHRHEGLLQQCQFAHTQMQAKQQELVQAEAEQQPLADTSDGTALGLALARAHQLGDHEGMMQALQSQIAEGQAILEAELQAMGPYALPLSVLQGMLVPDAAEVQALLVAQRTDQSALEAAKTQQQAQQAELERLQLVLAQSASALPSVTRQQVQEARQGRDASWQRLLSAAPVDDWSPHALQYQRLVVQADHLADARLEHIEHEAQYQTQVQRMELLVLELEQQAQRTEQLAQRLHERQLQWRNLVQACCLPDRLPLAAAAGWLERRSHALALYQNLGRLQRQYQDGSQAGHAAHTALLALLWPLEPILVPNSAARQPSLTECMALARQTLDEAERLRGQRESLRQQAGVARRALQTLEAEHDEAERQRQHWQQQWQQTLRQAGYDSSTEPAPMRAALEVMDSIDVALERIDTIRSERIDAMRADLEALAVAAQALCQRLAPQLQGQTAEAQVLALRQRLTLAQETQAQRQHWQQALEQARTGLQQAQQRQTELQAGLASLYALLGPQTDSSAAQWHQTLVGALARAAQAHQHEQELAQAQTSLAEQGDGLPLESLRAEVTTTPLADIPAKLEALHEQDRHWQARTEELGAAAQQARSQLAVFDGADRAAQAEARRQDAITRMAEAAQRYVQVHTVARWLHWSVARFRETQQGPMLALASQIFSRLTLGAFDRLIVDTDGPVPCLYGHRPQGGLVGVEGLSEGARDQLYLALRLAALDMHMQPGRSLPFMADDLFINFDDQRTTAGLQALGELARKTQVIFLTHHEHLVPLAQQALGAELNVLRLQP